MHPETQVEPLDIRRRDVAGVGSTVDHLGYNLRDTWWGVPPFGSVELAEIKKFNKLREVGLSRKHALNRAIEMVAVCRDLETIFSQMHFQSLQEGECRFLRALPDLEAGNQLRLRIHRNENPLIAKIHGIARADVSALLAQETPQLIALQVMGTDANVEHRGLSPLRSREHEAKNRALMHSRKARDGANAHSFKHHRKRLNRFCGVSVMGSQFGSSFAERRVTGLAAPALNAAFSGVSEPLAAAMLASDAGHGLFSACVEREKPYNEFGSKVRLAPRFGLAPQPVSAGSGALTQLFNWWRGHCHLQFATAQRPVPKGVEPFVFDSTKSTLPIAPDSFRLCGQLTQWMSKFVRSLATLHGDVQFTRFVETPENGVHRRERIGVSIDGKSHVGQTVLYFAGCQCLSASSHDFTNSFSEPLGSPDVIELLQERHDFCIFVSLESQDATNSRLYLIHLAFKFGVFLAGFFEHVEVGIQHPFFFRRD